MFQISSTPDGRVSRALAAEFLGFSGKTLANWSVRGLGPRSVRVDGRVFYYLTDLNAFVAQGGRV